MLGKKWNSGVILATQALLIYVWLIDLGFLLARYPGILTRDSITTVSQVVFGSYDNTMPYYHTRLVGLFVKLGLALTGDINVGIAQFHGFQIGL